MDIVLLYLPFNYQLRHLRIKRDTTGFYLLLIIGIAMTNTGLLAQVVNSNSNKDLDETIENSETFDRNEFRGRISNDYLLKFRELSKSLEGKENELASLRYRMEAVTERSKKVNAKEQKDLFKDNISTLKVNENQLSAEIRLIKKGLRLLQEYKGQPDAEKQKVLSEVGKLQQQMDHLDEKYKTEKKEIMLEGVDIDRNLVYMVPQTPDCKLVYNGIDEVTKRPRREVEKQFFFGYTHPKLKSYFKDKHFLSAEAKVIKHSKNSYLWLYITIASKDASRTYGRVEQKSTLKFELLNGEILYLQSAQNAIGKLEAFTGNTKYEIILPLDKSQTRLLTKSEVDRVGIMWTSGYEQYEVYNVDLIMNQLHCVNQK
jgi:hypothetical protein